MPECNTVAVVNRSGRPLMPTTARKARHLLKNGRAEIYRYTPIFTIRMHDMDGGDVQPVELKCDTGYQHIGLSICSESHEYVSRQYDLLADEPERHNDCLKYRRTRRNRLRYRKPRFDNRKGVICRDGFAPSIRNKRDRHADIIKAFCEIMPITDVYVEMGNFDTQVLKVIEEGKPLPEGKDYQHGERYGFMTLREAVFSRDDYTCQCCGRNTFKDNAILHEHHIGFWKNIPDRSNRMSNLMTVCERCHTSKNHKPGGKLYGLEPKLKDFKGATFMTMVRWSLHEKLKGALPNEVRIHITYGAATKLSRQTLGLPKSHANDAYAMGQLHPKHRAHFEHFKKRRHNNRILTKFYDAVYIDIRDGSKKKGSQLGCNRTKRSIPRNNPGNERMCRGEKTSKGRVNIRKVRHPIQAHDIVLYQGKKHEVKTSRTKTTKKGTYETVEFFDIPEKQFRANKVTVLRHIGGWTTL